MGALPRIEKRSNSVSLGGQTVSPRPPTSDQRVQTKAQALTTISRRITEESHQTSRAYAQQVQAVSDILSTHPDLVAEARENRRSRARLKSLERKRRVRPSNPLLMYPQPDWKDGGAGIEFFGMPRISSKCASKRLSSPIASSHPTSLHLPTPRLHSEPYRAAHACEWHLAPTKT